MQTIQDKKRIDICVGHCPHKLRRLVVIRRSRALYIDRTKIKILIYLLEYHSVKYLSILIFPQLHL